MTLYAPFTPLDSRNQSTGHSDYRLRSLATDTILHANTTYGLVLGTLRISEPSRDLLALRPGETVTQNVQIGVHDQIPFPGRNERDEQLMTVCAVPIEDLVPGDYSIERPEFLNGQMEGWYWDEGEMGQIVRRHSLGGVLGWLGWRLMGRVEVSLSDEKGGVEMEMKLVGEVPVLTVTGSCVELAQEDGRM